MSSKLIAQPVADLFVKDAIKATREKTLNNIIQNSILKNLSLPLTETTEQNWEDAFYSMELIQYKTSFVNQKIKTAFDSIEIRSNEYQRALLELVYANYTKDFLPQVVGLMTKTTHPKVLAMCAEYIFANNQKEKYKYVLANRMDEISIAQEEAIATPFFTVLQTKLKKSIATQPPIKDFFTPNFLKNELVVFSFQRKNRNFPGLALVRNSDGSFVKNANNTYFNVPQLARSVNNIPGYLTNGNTPQGIFKITGFDVSKSNFIGPTTNIQLLMPFEKVEELVDTAAENLGNNYANLLPPSWKNYFPIYEAYYAGLAGRTEIIAHGTTVNPEYYKNQPYYPHTPTMGCLCTKEIWSGVDGKRLESNQQKLVDALQQTNMSKGYLIVIELDDINKPVLLQNILTYLNRLK
jgi:hypothetical protein